MEKVDIARYLIASGQIGIFLKQQGYRWKNIKNIKFKLEDC